MKPVPPSEPLAKWRISPLRAGFVLGIAGLGLYLWKPLLIWGLLAFGLSMDDEIPVGMRLWLSEQVLALKPQSVQALKLKAEACEQKGANLCAWQTWERLFPLQLQPEEQAWIHLQLGELNLNSLPTLSTSGLTATGHLVGSPGSGGSSNSKDRLLHLNQALSLDPELEEAWFARGLLKARDLGDCRGARADLEKACSLGYKLVYGPINLEMCNITGFSC